MPKYGNSARTPKNGIFKNFFIFVERFPDLLPTSPQPPPDIKIKSSNARKRDFGLLCPNMEIRPQAPKNGIFQNFFIFKLYHYLPKTKKFGCVGRGDLTSVFFSKVVKY